MATLKYLCLVLTLSALPLAAVACAESIPAATGTALDSRTVVLPRDLSPQATVLILGFTQHSQDATTAWEKAVRAKADLAYFDIPFIEDAPGFIRPMIVRSIRKQVPAVLRSRFVPLTANEAAWKQAVRFTPSAPDAAYVLLVDTNGVILWQTHEPYSPTLFAQLSAKAKKPVGTE